MNAMLDPERLAMLQLAAAQQASQNNSHNTAKQTLIDMGYTEVRHD